MDNTDVAASRNRIVMRRPASWWGGMWREALPTGNGVVGASVYGGVRQETVLLNHGQLWHGGLRGELPDISGLLPAIRQRMRAGDYAGAKTMMADELAARGYDSKRETPLPLGDLLITMPTGEGFRRYRRTLDMETGEISVRWESAQARYERSLFVSRRDDVVVCELRADGAPLAAELTLLPHDWAEAHKSVPEYVAASAETKAEGGLVYYAASGDDGTDFGAVLRVIADESEITCSEGRLILTGGSRALLLMHVFVKGVRERDWAQAAAKLSGVDLDYEQLLERHAELHRPLFQSAAIRLGPEKADAEVIGQSNEALLLQAYEGEGLPIGLTEKMWAFGRYLFISATRSDGMPIPLYGLWGGEYRLMWSHFMANENVQMTYWHAAVGGLSELVPALFAYYEGMLDVFRDNARKLYGCRGIFIPAGTTPNVGTPFQPVPVILYWTGAAGWLAQHMYEYARFTGDRDFLAQRALPFMREAALFYQDYFEIGEDGRVRSYPSVSPENTPGNYYPKGPKPLAHPLPNTINATMDIAIARELLTHLIEGSREAGLYEAERGEWEELLRRLPPYQVNADGAAKEWLHPDFEDNYHHRHISHSYPVFPGHEVTRHSDPVIFEAFRVAIEKRLVIGIADQTAWSLSHLANLYARMEDGDRALECLELLARSCLLPNLLTVHNDWRGMGVTLTNRRAPIQLDANMGWVSAVQEMLLYVSPHQIRLLPALPAAWAEGSFRGLRYMAGAVEMEWWDGGSRCRVTLRAEREGPVRISLPPRAVDCRWELTRTDGRKEIGRFLLGKDEAGREETVICELLAAGDTLSVVCGGGNN